MQYSPFDPLSPLPSNIIAPSSSIPRLPFQKSLLRSFGAVAKQLFGRGRNDGIWLSALSQPGKPARP